MTRNKDNNNWAWQNNSSWNARWCNEDILELKLLLRLSNMENIDAIEIERYIIFFKKYSLTIVYNMAHFFIYTHYNTFSINRFCILQIGQRKSKIQFEKDFPLLSTSVVYLYRKWECFRIFKLGKWRVLGNMNKSELEKITVAKSSNRLMRLIKLNDTTQKINGCSL